MAPSSVRDRDAGIRRISTATRWMAGIGIGLTAALTAFFAGRAQSASTTPTSSGQSSQTATNGGGTGQGAAAQPPDDGFRRDDGSSSGGSSSSGASSGISQPRVHTRSGGS